MKKVITYGTYDLLHYGHVKLLERAKALGDYLIVGVTSDDFDKNRGKINVQQTLIERIENIKSTGLADEIIVEEYDGQKIDDICRNNIDIFAIGSDWIGKFDYLKQYCEVIYLDRTNGVSSTNLRNENSSIKLGVVGNALYLNKIARESKFVNGIKIVALCSQQQDNFNELFNDSCIRKSEFEDILPLVDAIYIFSTPQEHYHQIKRALLCKKHVLCESPISLNDMETKELFELARSQNCVLLEANKTAYMTAFSRMILLTQSGKIGNVVSIEGTCTSLSKETDVSGWNSIFAWGPVALLPVLKIFGIEYESCEIVSILKDKESTQDLMTKLILIYKRGIASINVGKGIKSEGELIISGTKGYIYVPSPWWKTEYFEIRYEHLNDTKKYYYSLDGEGIRNELLSFSQNISKKNNLRYISTDISYTISKIMFSFTNGINLKKIYLEDNYESK